MEKHQFNAILISNGEPPSADRLEHAMETIRSFNQNCDYVSWGAFAGIVLVMLFQPEYSFTSNAVPIQVGVTGICMLILTLALDSRTKADWLHPLTDEEALQEIAEAANQHGPVATYYNRVQLQERHLIRAEYEAIKSLVNYLTSAAKHYGEKKEDEAEEENSTEAQEPPKA